MRKKITVSIIVATLNSSKNLENVIRSIKSQEYPQSEIEIVIVDGGSLDETLNIARKNACKIIHNPKVLPQWAKYLGYIHASGRYITFLDSDEVIEDKHSLARKISVFASHKNVHAVTGSGYTNPKGYPFLNRYISDFGDPFSYFIYRSSTDSSHFIPSVLKHCHVVEQNKDMLICSFSRKGQRPIFELAAMGGVVDLAYMKKHAPEIREKPELVWHMFNVLVLHDSYFAILKNDALLHYSVSTYRKYLAKISSRIVSNVFASGAEGYNGREVYMNPMSRYKKYLFIPYALSIVIPLADSVYLALSRKSVGYLIHMPLSMYTALCILYYVCLKIIGIKPAMKSYDGSAYLK